MTPQEYNKTSNNYEAICKAASKKLNVITKGSKNSFGLTDSIVKNSDSYKNAKSEFIKASQILRAFNKSVSNNIKREAAKIRQAEKLKALSNEKK